MKHAPERRRTQIRGLEAVEQALDDGAELRLLVVSEQADAETMAKLLERARTLAIPTRTISAMQLRRLTPLASSTPEGVVTDVVALAGPPPEAKFDEVFEREGVIWLLVGSEYPGNVGWVIRSAEVSGAAAVVIDADFERPQRRDSVRLSMRADRYFPVFFEETRQTLQRARAAGRRIVIVEDVGAVAPWEADLTGDPLLVIGGERGGVPAEVVAAADEVIRIPMAGFLPTYNLQAAMAVVMGEHLRQSALRDTAPIDGDQ